MCNVNAQQLLAKAMKKKCQSQEKNRLNKFNKRKLTWMKLNKKPSKQWEQIPHNTH